MRTDRAANDWFTSSYSGPHNNNCLEARIAAHGIDIRDSKDPGGGRLHFNFRVWRDFVTRLPR
ncbi:DUF397 domain-containing protein [Saccharopolyspora sp. 6V]|uniref:DUF397 domain-containing protein n=1 Tax=Saccharopolyspora sp. 6V TaxID=2877239 RepID=UPI001CD655F4|nr:DUF397 domain-containing protein [Saccharopolyspora sp. 6V]MCA1192527.1 DUF397 domain-containing protein [Saccharopolyspora sp. 6V]